MLITTFCKNTNIYWFFLNKDYFKEFFIMTHSKKAYELFMHGYNFSQCTEWKRCVERFQACLWRRECCADVTIPKITNLNPSITQEYKSLPINFTRATAQLYVENCLDSATKIRCLISLQELRNIKKNAPARELFQRPHRLWTIIFRLTHLSYEKSLVAIDKCPLMVYSLTVLIQIIRLGEISKLWKQKSQTEKSVCS